MELKKANLPGLLTTLALMALAVSARATTIVPITGDAGFRADVEYTIDVSGSNLALSISTCDATDPMAWSKPFTFTSGSLGLGCTAGSASYGSYTWTTSYPGPAPDEIDASVTGITGKCGRMMVNPNGTWSDTCAATFSGSFDAFPASGPGPSLSGTLTGTGSVGLFGPVVTGAPYFYVADFGASFTGKATVTSTVPEPASLPLLMIGLAALLVVAVRRMPAC
jgi:hypothetical protein